MAVTIKIEWKCVCVEISFFVHSRVQSSYEGSWKTFREESFVGFVELLDMPVCSHINLGHFYAVYSGVQFDIRFTENWKVPQGRNETHIILKTASMFTWAIESKARHITKWLKVYVCGFFDKKQPFNLRAYDYITLKHHFPYDHRS